MSVALYMDVHVPRAITIGLRNRGVDVLTAQEDDAVRTPDPQLLARSTRLNRLLVTQDRDFLIIASHLQAEGIHFSGVAFGEQLRMGIGKAIEDLSLIGLLGSPAEFANRVQYLPL